MKPCKEGFMQVKCPRCHKKTEYENNPYRPFCSERCKMIDLGHWASEKYVVPTEDLLNHGTETEKKENFEDQE